MLRSALGSGAARCWSVRSNPAVASRGGGSGLRVPPRALLSSTSRHCASNSVTVKWVQRTASEHIGLLLLPVRHAFHTGKLWVLRQVYPSVYASEDFGEGATQAFRFVQEGMGDLRDVREIRELVSDDLIERLREEAKKAEKRDDDAVFKSVLDAEFLGLWNATATVDDNGEASIFVTAVISACEEYTSVASSSGDADEDVAEKKKEDNTENAKDGDADKVTELVWHVSRIHKWTFKRHLPDEPAQELGDWCVVGVDKRRWRLPPLARSLMRQ
eukprot:TRINITY_DN73395_c0_g1_i1.p1 TRINITY_DN73395_c0_g1~~TRINITY_DN73395_c0_g1_i1.p1  ORF type:complete len:273 (+),score=68.53 TRINITY_DN73395_c0_g1_i1:89-907(+)